jgi:hypothetical protein
VSNDTDNNVVHLPTRGSDSGAMPDAPDIGDLFYSEPPNSGDGVPPESPEETTMELPAIRTPISPETALRETGLPSAPGDEDDENEEGEYTQRRSLADRLGDWLELRLEMARNRHAEESAFREAEIARKTALLEARTAKETAAIEQNSKLRTAITKAKADTAAARGKADADRARFSSSGMGADKGRSKPGAGGGRGSGTNGSGTGAGRGAGGTNSPKGTGKGTDRAPGGRNSGPKGNESAGGSKGRQNGSGGSGWGKGGSGNSGSGKGDGRNSPAANARSERTRSRQERAAARQSARQQRRATDQAASLADRTKDRDQDRAARQTAREERRAAKAQREAARKARREAARAADPDRTTLGAAVADEAQRRWDKRRPVDKDKTKKAAPKDSEATTKKLTKDDPEPDGPGTAAKEPKSGEKSDKQPSDASSGKDDKDTEGTGTGDDKDPAGADDSSRSRAGRAFGEWLRDFFAKAEEGTDPPPEPEGPSSRARPEDFNVTVDSPGRPSRPPEPEPEKQDIQDADIVDDPADPFGAYATRSESLPRAPEPHTQRPGTSRPTPQEEPVASEVNKTGTKAGPARMAAKHRTDITFGEYLMEIVNIAIAAGLDKDRAEDLADALGKVADALRDMAANLVGDHNIATEVVNQITDLADAAGRMKRQAEQCAVDCELASEAARLAAMSVGRTYSEDIQAMDDAGLAQASASAHHD